jgi:NAD(P)-dependent dehydrogenase (short-subunit alcohol dehydrogenase family)
VVSAHRRSDDRVEPDASLRHDRRTGRAILFLVSDEASYITGTVLPVGGGDQG